MLVFWATDPFARRYASSQADAIQLARLCHLLYALAVMVPAHPKDMSRIWSSCYFLRFLWIGCGSVLDGSGGGLCAVDQGAVHFAGAVERCGRRARCSKSPPTGSSPRQGALGCRYGNATRPF